MTKPNVRLRFEELESRIVLDATLPKVPHFGPALVATPFPLTTQIHGVVNGTYKMDAPAPGKALHCTVQGQGTLTGLGAVTVTGSLQAPGLGQHGVATGTLTLTSSQGTVQVQLQGPAVSISHKIPNHFKFTINGHTEIVTFHFQHNGSSLQISFS